jgi:hypothetical protein
MSERQSGGFAAILGLAPAGAFLALGRQLPKNVQAKG